MALRDAIDAGLVPVPNMSVAKAYVTIPGGGGEITGIADDVNLPDEMRTGVVVDAADAHRKAANILANRADFLKLIATGAVLTVGFRARPAGADRGRDAGRRRRGDPARDTTPPPTRTGPRA